MKFYTDPGFFFDIWCNKLLKDTEPRIVEKKRRKTKNQLQHQSVAPHISHPVVNNGKQFDEVFFQQQQALNMTQGIAKQQQHPQAYYQQQHQQNYFEDHLPPPPCGMQKVLCRFKWQTSAPIAPGLVRPTCAFIFAPSRISLVNMSEGLHFPLTCETAREPSATHSRVAFSLVFKNERQNT